MLNQFFLPTNEYIGEAGRKERMNMRKVLKTFKTKKKFLENFNKN